MGIDGRTLASRPIAEYPTHRRQLLLTRSKNEFVKKKIIRNVLSAVEGGSWMHHYLLRLLGNWNPLRIQILSLNLFGELLQNHQGSR